VLPISNEREPFFVLQTDPSVSATPLKKAFSNSSPDFSIISGSLAIFRLSLIPFRTVPFRAALRIDLGCEQDSYD